jgi:cytochrome c-type biogenesis protein
MLTVLFALLAGILTIAAPCSLPVLPILLGASIGQTSRARPALIALGFVISFAAVAVAFSVVPELFGIGPDNLRMIAVILLVVFGLLMLWPRPFESLSARFGILASRSDRTAARSYSGNIGGFVLGTTLGLIWTPCAGPVLGSILTVIVTSAHIERGALLLLVYAIGAAIPMLAIAYGGQAVTTRVRGVVRIAHRLQQGFGVLVVAFAVAMYFQYDTLITGWLSDFYPNGQVGL